MSSAHVRKGSFDCWAFLTRVPANLVFDDESIEAVLYGRSRSAPTPASIFAPLQAWLEEYAGQVDLLTDDAFRQIIAILERAAPVSPDLFDDLLAVAKAVLPEWPHPPRRPPIPSVGKLLELLGAMAGQWNDEPRMYRTRAELWQWYEFEHRHADARRILCEMYESDERLQRTDRLCNIVNCVAFQFSLEKDWSTAQAEFERACKLAREAQHDAAWTSNRIQWWACRWEAEGPVVAAKMVAELQTLERTCQRLKHDMARRRALVYLARGLAALLQRQDAVKAAEAAVTIDRQMDTIYLAADEALLTELQSGTEFPRP